MAECQAFVWWCWFKPNHSTTMSEHDLEKAFPESSGGKEKVETATRDDLYPKKWTRKVSIF